MPIVCSGQYHILDLALDSPLQGLILCQGLPDTGYDEYQ
jgi:hypothetical protein